MATFLFDDIIFGPVQSRRLGVSLGINLLPTDFKFCTFDCLYCECGWTFQSKRKLQLPKVEEVSQHLEQVLKSYARNNKPIDSITFAGNGEPTIHPQFARVIDNTIALRQKWMPEAKISVLSNATQIHKPKVAAALNKIDQNILKLDAGTADTFNIINRPEKGFTFEKLVACLKQFQGRLIIQTLFLRGHIDGKPFDNSTAEEVKAWLKIVKEVRPQSVMLYPIERDTPAQALKKITHEELLSIAKQVEALGIETQVF